MNLFPRFGVACAFFCLASFGFSATPTLIYPATNDQVFLTIPHFDWTDVVESPYPGSYQIQIAETPDFSAPVDTDILPAVISHYSPDFELIPTHSYYWRVRYLNPEGQAATWSEPAFFTLKAPFKSIDVLASDGWAEIKTKLAQAMAATTNIGAVELRFPENQVFHLEQIYDPLDDSSEYLLHLISAKNVIVNGRGSTLVLKAAGPGVMCGLYFAQASEHLQIKNLTLDYDPTTTMQYAGAITALDKSTRTFTVEVDPTVYPDFADMADTNDVYFVDAANQQRVGFQGTSYLMEQTWREAQIGPHTYQFTAQSNTWGRYNDELAIGDFCVGSGRGGDSIMLFNNINDFVANNLTVNGCRGRYFIARVELDWVRCINNRFLRTGGRIMGAPSGGVNDKGRYSWFENNRFEYTRDDSMHSGGNAGGTQDSIGTVLRNNTVVGSFRNSIWIHSDRCWVDHNTTILSGTGGLQIGGAGINTEELLLINVGLITNNTIISPRRYGIASNSDPRIAPDPETGFFNRGLTISGNVVRDHQSGQGFLLEYLEDSIVENNLVESSGPDWRIYSDSATQYGIEVNNSSRISGTGNVIDDERIPEPDHLFINDATSAAVTLEASSAPELGLQRITNPDLEYAFTLGFRSLPGVDYALEGCSDLVGDHWTQEQLIIASGYYTLVHLAQPTDRPQFWRIRGPVRPE